MKNVNVNVNVKSSIVDKVKEMQDILNHAVNIGTNAKQKILEDETADYGTIVRDLTKEDSILKEIQDKKSEKKTFTEEDLKETLLNFSFAQDVMNKFNSLINEEANLFLSETKKAEEMEDEDDKNPNIYIKLTIIDDRDRMLFKELLFGTSERRRPIYVNIGDYDFFFEYFDEEQPVFTFNKESFKFFFDNDLNKLKEYVKINKCTFDFEREIKFDNIIVEILNKGKEKVGKVEKKEKEIEIENAIVETPQQEDTKYKKVYKVKTVENTTLFILTDKPGDIFEKISDVLSVKVMGFGFQLDSDVS